MKLLLDTHIWIWSVLESGRLSRRVAHELTSGANQLWLSPISLWEIVLLHRKGRFGTRGDLSAWIADAKARVPVLEAPLTFEVAEALLTLRLPHDDPADQFLVASAKVFGLTLVTADQNLIRQSGISVLAN